MAVIILKSGYQHLKALLSEYPDMPGNALDLAVRDANPLRGCWAAASVGGVCEDRPMVGYRALEDGSWLVVRQIKWTQPPRRKAADDVLGPVHDFIVGGIIAGAAGNLSYDLLKACVADLVSRGEAEDRPPASAAEVSALIDEFMIDAGYGSA
jgi:hypothetical protein